MLNDQPNRSENVQLNTISKDVQIVKKRFVDGSEMGAEYIMQWSQAKCTFVLVCCTSWLYSHVVECWLIMFWFDTRSRQTVKTVTFSPVTIYQPTVP